MALPETGLSRGLFARCIARQRLPHIRVRNPELSSDLRWLEPALKAARTAFNLPGVKATETSSTLRFVNSRSREPPATSLLFNEHRRTQLVEVLVAEAPYSVGQIFGENVPE